MIKKCLNCDREIQVYTKRRLVRKFCNSTCLLEHRKKNEYWKKRYARLHPELKTRQCFVCHKLIYKSKERKTVAKYCSDKCLYIACHKQEKITVTLEQYRKLMRMEESK